MKMSKTNRNEKKPLPISHVLREYGEVLGKTEGGVELSKKTISSSQSTTGRWMFCIISFFTAICVGFFTVHIFEFVPTWGVSSWWWVFGTITFLFALLCIFTILVPEKKWIVGLHLSSLLGWYGGAMIFPRNYFDVALFLFMVVSMYIAFSSVYKEKEGALSLKWGKVIRGGMGWYLTAFSLFIIMLYINVLHVATERIIFPEAYLRDTLQATTPLVEKVLPGLDWNMSFDTFLTTQATQKLDTYMKEASSDSLPHNISPTILNQQKKHMIRGVVSDLKANWEKVTGFHVEGSTPLYRVVSKIFNERLIPSALKESSWFLIIIACLAFLFVRSFGIFLSWSVFVVGFIILELLVFTGVAVVSFEPRSKEKITFS